MPVKAGYVGLPQGPSMYVRGTFGRVWRGGVRHRPWGASAAESWCDSTFCFALVCHHLRPLQQAHQLHLAGALVSHCCLLPQLPGLRFDCVVGVGHALIDDTRNLNLVIRNDVFFQSRCILVARSRPIAHQEACRELPLAVSAVPCGGRRAPPRPCP